MSESAQQRFARLDILTLVHKLARPRARRVGLDVDDAVQEASLKAWEVVLKYVDKPDADLLRLVNASICNMFIDLGRKRAVETHALEVLAEYAKIDRGSE